MKKNVGSIDRLVRFILAAILLVLVIAKVVTGVVAIVLIVLAAVFMLTGLINFCPLYAPFGINTGKKKE